MPLRAGARHSNVNILAANRMFVNVHPLFSEQDALHHRYAGPIKEIGATGRDGALL